MRAALLFLLALALPAGAADYYNILDSQGVVSASTAFRAAAGTAGAPSYSFTGDTTTGLLYDTGGVGIVTGGVERWLVNASGALNPLVDNTYDIGGTTKPRDIAAARSIAAPSFTINGGTALTVYSEGTWTPAQGAGLTVVGAFTSSGTYTRIGRMILVEGRLNGATSVAVSATGDLTSNLPFACSTLSLGGAVNNSGSAYAGVASTNQRAIAITAIGATPSIYFSLTCSI